MALIKCPECNTEVSDRAEKCIKCGFPMVHYVPPIMCPECGGESLGGAVTCSKCGFPLKERSGSTPQPNSGCIDATTIAPHFDDLEVHDSVKNFSLWRGFVNGWKKYFKFKDRARRKEFWGWNLFCSLLYIGLCVLTAIIATLVDVNDEDMTLTVVSWILVAAIFIPSTAVSVRRMHDTGRSGRPAVVIMILNISYNIQKDFGMESLPFALALLIGWIGLFIYCCQDGTPGENIYGPDPKGRESSIDIDINT